MGFLKNGKIKENEFAALIGANEFSTKEQDISEHWDVKITKKIDVKALKKINRSDKNPDQSWHWVEIKNVNGGNGWLYGDADLFAFELVNYWVIVEKNRLQEFIAKHITKNYCLVPTPYQLYQRKNRKDVLTIISSFDLCFLADDIIQKTTFIN